MTGITFKKNQNYLNDPCKNQTFGSNKIILTTRLMELYDKIQETVQFLKEKTGFDPEIGIILGTGLSGLADQIDAIKEIAYGDIPHFPQSTVQSHAGKLVFGHLHGRKVVAMAGRFHWYEGYSMEALTFPVRVLKMLGIQRLMISNAAGGVNEDYQAGDLVFIEDHINLHPDNPLRGKNDDRLGPRFPDMLYAYDKALNEKAWNWPKSIKSVPTKECMALPGPNLETPGGVSDSYWAGADVVGMSTVPEVLVARHMELPVFVFSVVTNQCYPIEMIKETSVDDVIAMAKRTEENIKPLIKDLIAIL
ncbi:MAG: purine-nucleoside phosphorylase [Saprospiraceae bacterium]